MCASILSPYGFRWASREASLSVNIMGHVGISISMVKTVAENVMTAEIWDLVMADRAFEAMKTLLGVS